MAREKFECQDAYRSKASMTRSTGSISNMFKDYLDAESMCHEDQYGVSFSCEDWEKSWKKRQRFNEWRDGDTIRFDRKMKKY